MKCCLKYIFLEFLMVFICMSYITATEGGGLFPIWIFAEDGINEDGTLQVPINVTPETSIKDIKIEIAKGLLNGAWERSSKKLAMLNKSDNIAETLDQEDATLSDYGIRGLCFFCILSKNTKETCYPRVRQKSYSAGTDGLLYLTQLNGEDMVKTPVYISHHMLLKDIKKECAALFRNFWENSSKKLAVKSPQGYEVLDQDDVTLHDYGLWYADPSLKLLFCELFILPQNVKGHSRKLLDKSSNQEPVSVISHQLFQSAHPSTATAFTKTCLLEEDEAAKKVHVWVAKKGNNARSQVDVYGNTTILEIKRKLESFGWWGEDSYRLTIKNASNESYELLADDITLCEYGIEGTSDQALTNQIMAITPEVMADPKIIQRIRIRMNIVQPWHFSSRKVFYVNAYAKIGDIKKSIASILQTNYGSDNMEFTLNGERLANDQIVGNRITRDDLIEVSKKISSSSDVTQDSSKNVPLKIASVVVVAAVAAFIYKGMQWYKKRKAKKHAIPQVVPSQAGASPLEYDENDQAEKDALLAEAHKLAGV